MSPLSAQLNTANSAPTIESVPFFHNRLKSLDIKLLAETVLITIAAVLAIKLFGTNWFITPCILVCAALIPAVIKKTQLREIGLSFGQTKHSLILLSWTCLLVFPAMFCGLWLLRFYGVNFPLQPILPQDQQWVSWLFYQFMYVAVAEEVFFRGFLQTNIIRLMRKVKTKHPSTRLWVGVVTSAACFAVAHVIVQGQIISSLTFLPGLLLGWLFIRTRSLLAPILFHGLANLAYYLMAAVLAV